MSLIGPRPTLRYQVETYTERQRRRLDVRPGLTGWAQVHGRATLPWAERIELDVWYVEHRSPLPRPEDPAANAARPLRRHVPGRDGRLARLTSRRPAVSRPGTGSAITTLTPAWRDFRSIPVRSAWRSCSLGLLGGALYAWRVRRRVRVVRRRFGERRLDRPRPGRYHRRRSPLHRLADRRGHPLHEHDRPVARARATASRCSACTRRSSTTRRCTSRPVTPTSWRPPGGSIERPGRPSASGRSANLVPARCRTPIPIRPSGS